jgi:hypothetical protein
MEGDLELYNFSFEIIGDPADEKGSLVEIHSHSFSQDDENLSKVPALTITPCRILVKTAETPDTNTDDPITTGPSTEEPETTPDATPEVEEDKKPTGDWYIDPDSNQAILAEKDEEGKDVLHQFTTEYEKDEEGNTTGIILYDEPERAIEHARKATQIDSTNRWYKQLYGQSLLVGERYSEALPVFEKLVQTERNPDFYRLLALLYDRDRRPFSAIAILDSAERQFGINPYLGEIKRRLLLSTHQFDRALEEALKVVETIP